MTPDIDPDAFDEEESDTLGPAFQQVDREVQDNWNAEVVVPEVEEDELVLPEEEDPA